MHQIDLKCVAYGYPNVSIFWRKAGENLDSESYLFNNDGKAKKVKEKDYKYKPLNLCFHFVSVAVK